MANASGTLAGLDLLGMDEIPNDAGRWLIHGAQGSGKTLLASTIARLGPTLYIDLVGEKGIRSFAKAGYADNITIIRPKSAPQLQKLFDALDNGVVTDKQGRPFVAIVIDSLTSVQKMSMRYMRGHSETAMAEIMKGGAPADQRTWGQTLDIMQDMATFWYGLADGDRSNPLHVVMTAQTKVVDDEIASTSTRTPDVQKGALSAVLATPDYIVYTEEEEDFENPLDDGTLTTRHIMRFGGHVGYRTKARIPVNLRGKLPSIIGRVPQLDAEKNPIVINGQAQYKSPDLAQLSRILGIGGAQAVAAKPAAKPVAA